MGYRCVLRHVQQAGDRLGGWGEGWWNSTPDLTVAIDNTAELREKLDVCKGVPCYLPFARISKDGDFRNVQQVVYAGSPGGTAATYGDADYPTSALQLKLSAPGPYTSTQWLRGIPDKVVDKGGIYTPSGLAGFITRINSFLALLSSSSKGWSLRGLNRATPQKPVTAVNTVTGVVTCKGHGLGNAGDVTYTRLKGFNAPKGLNSVWRVTVIDADSFQLAFYVPPTTPTVASGKNPTSRAQIYTYVQIAKAEIVRATAHYTGRPTSLLGGRRRNRNTRRVGQPVGP